MKVLITGAGGFVGGRLADLILAEAAGLERLCLTDLKISRRYNDARVRAVEGDLRDAQVRARALDGGVDILIHLAVIPGGAAESNYALSRAVNVDATLDLMEAAAASGVRPRVVFASSVAIFGAPLPDRVDDDTPPRPAMIYGAHKLMLEIALADFTRRGVLDAVSVRLPGIVPRPRAPSGMKSAFMSEIFHALAAGEGFTAPVSKGASVWVMSVSQCARNLWRAACMDASALGADRAMTMPALRVTLGELADAIAMQTTAAAEAVRYAPDATLEPQFGRQPPLETRRADRAGLTHDGDVESLVRRALADMKAMESK